MMNFQKHFESGDRTASGRTGELVQAADRLSRFHRVSWKEALGKIASPAFRLHRYRTVHNRLLQNALCELDCTDADDCSA
jgi:hypothetical protein